MYTINKKLLITTVVVGKEYQEYIPLYIYSIINSYPEYDVKIFITENLESNVKDALISINCLDRIEKVNVKFSHNTKRQKQAARFLLNKSDLDGYNYIYIGDIDFVILREHTPLLEYHLDHCRATSLPYSNIVRKGTFRLSGLHFFKAREYFENVNQIINKYRDKIYAGEDFDLKHPKSKSSGGADEQFLYRIIEEAGLSIVRDDKWQRRYHGIHLAQARSRDKRHLLSDPDYKNYYTSNECKYKFIKFYRQDKKLHALLKFTPKVKKEIDYIYRVLSKKYKDIKAKIIAGSTSGKSTFVASNFGTYKGLKLVDGDKLKDINYGSTEWLLNTNGNICWFNARLEEVHTDVKYAIVVKSISELKKNLEIRKKLYESHNYDGRLDELISQRHDIIEYGIKNKIPIFYSFEDAIENILSNDIKKRSFLKNTKNYLIIKFIRIIKVLKRYVKNIIMRNGS